MGGLVHRIQVCQQQARRNVAAQVVGHRRKAEHIAAQVQSHLPGAENARIKENRGIGILKHQPGITAQEKVDHGGVAPNDQGRHRLPAHACAELIGEPFDIPQDQRPELTEIFPVLFHRQDPVQDIQAEGHLTVDTAGIAQDLAGDHIHQFHFQGGAANVQSQAVKRPGGIPRLHPDDLPALLGGRQGDRHVISPILHQWVQGSKRRKAHGHVFQAQCIQYPLPIRPEIILGGLWQDQVALFRKGHRLSS